MESVQHQTYRDFEAIIVNDGTKDRSAELAKEFIQKYDLKNFRLIEKENGGLSSARNAGLEYASGEWIVFVDSDDYLENNYLSVMMAAIEEHPADKYSVGYIAFDTESNREVFRSGVYAENGKVPDNLDVLCSFSYIWRCCFKHEIIKKHNLRFDERVRYGEDNAFQFDYNSHITSFYEVNEYVYHYRYMRSDSLTKSFKSPKEKYHIYEHMVDFCNAFEPNTLMEAVRRNEHLNGIMWGTLNAYVSSLILDNKCKIVREEMQKPWSKGIFSAYVPKSKKDRVFMTLWKGPFFLFVWTIKMYYRHFGLIKRIRMIKIAVSSK